MYLQGFGQDIRFLLGLVAEVVAHASELYAFGSDGVHGVVVALDQLVTVQCVELGLFYCGLEGWEQMMLYYEFKLGEQNL